MKNADFVRDRTSANAAGPGERVVSAGWALSALVAVQFAAHGGTYRAARAYGVSNS